MRFETIAIHAGERPDKATGAVSVPIYQTSTYAWKDIGTTTCGIDYSREANPTRNALQDTLVALEGGHAGFAFATGIAAELTTLFLLKPGDHVISVDDVYGGTYRLFHDVMSGFGLEFSFVKMNSRSNIEKALKPNTKMLWLETPSNPLLNIIDLEMVADVAGKHKLLTVLDNTFATPLFLKPVDYGIDIIVHSLTKYLNGHCDVVGGAVITTTKELTEKIRFLQNAIGTGAAPFDSWLVLRGIETLAVRVRQQEQNALQVASYLQGNDAVKKVYYLGLTSHPGHETAVRQMKGFGGVVSFEINGGMDAVASFFHKLKIFTMAVSLGGTLSLAERPATMSHMSMPEAHRQKAGIGDDLIRLSIGLEHHEDLIEDLSQALS